MGLEEKWPVTDPFFSNQACSVRPQLKAESILSYKITLESTEKSWVNLQ